MNKKKDKRYKGRYNDKKIIFDAKERISFFYPIFVLATN